MWSTSQKIKTIIIWLIIILWCNFVIYWQENETENCLTCWWPSSQITTFIDFTNQIIDALPSNSDLIAQWPQYRIFWPRQWGIYNWILSSINPWSILSNIVAGTLKNFDKRQSYIRATTELIGIYGIDIIKDGWLWFAIAAQPRPIVRDYQLLLDVDTLVWDKIYDIWVAWWYGKQLSEEQINTIRNIIFNYSGDGESKIFTTQPTIDSTTTSTQVLSLLLRTNNRFKKVLTLWGKTRDSNISIWWSNQIKVSLNPIYFNALQVSYNCVRIGSSGKSCSSSFKKFKENINNIVKTFKEKWPEQSRKKIETASKRLATRSLQIWWATNNEFYKKNIDDYTQRETELLSSQWLRKRTWLWILTWSLSVNIPRKEFWNMRKETTTLAKDISNITLSWVKYTTRTVDTRRDAIKNSSQSKNNSDYKDITSLPATIQQINIASDLNNIIIEQESILNNQIIQSSTDTQDALAKTLFHIRIINTILYNNIKEDIARTCELQCSNLWWICR